jgi:hypothetical protein
VALVYGALTFLFCRYFVYVMLGLTHFFIGWWLRGQAGTYWPQIWPPVTDENLAYHLLFPALAWPEAVSAILISIWVYIVLGLLAGFVVSFYFSANTIIYFLLRREVDATETDDVYLEETDDDFGENASVIGPRPMDDMPPAAPAQPASEAGGAATTTGTTTTTAVSTGNVVVISNPPADGGTAAASPPPA